jgi:hypothetical protein
VQHAITYARMCWVCWVCVVSRQAGVGSGQSLTQEPTCALLTCTALCCCWGCLQGGPGEYGGECVGVLWD